MKDIHVEQRRRLTSLVYFDDILLVNIAIVVAFRSVFFSRISQWAREALFSMRNYLKQPFDVSVVFCLQMRLI